CLRGSGKPRCARRAWGVQSLRRRCDRFSRVTASRASFWMQSASGRRTPRHLRRSHRERGSPSTPFVAFWEWAGWGWCMWRRRTVALKLIRRERASAGVLRRFEHEAEVLGRLQHAGIAQIHEAGAAPVAVTGGAAAGPTPFIAMELIDGRPLKEHAELHRLDA